MIRNPLNIFKMRGHTYAEKGMTKRDFIKQVQQLIAMTLDESDRHKAAFSKMSVDTWNETKVNRTFSEIMAFAKEQNLTR